MREATPNYNGTQKNKRKRSIPQKKKATSYHHSSSPPSSPPVAKKAKINPAKVSEKRQPSKRKAKSIDSPSSNVLIDNIMPVKESAPDLSVSSPSKKPKTNRTLHFLSQVAEKVFKDKFEKMLDKMLNRS
jgi:hypothetical protein